MTGALHVLEFQLSPLPPPLSLAAAKSTTVSHSGTGSPRLSLKVVGKTERCAVSNHSHTPRFAECVCTLTANVDLKHH